MECRCGFVITVDPLLTCDECGSELSWNEKSARWECSDCHTIVADALAEDRFVSRNDFVTQER
jgi:ribosomal protein L37AE/L43A